MTHLCQVLCCFFATGAGLAAVATQPSAPLPTPPPATFAPTVEVRGWQPRPFAELVLDDPELAACWSLTPRWWNVAGTPRSLPGGPEVAAALAATLAGVLAPAPPPDSLSLVVATADTKLPDATVFGSTVLLMVPDKAPTSLADLTRTMATALLADASAPAAVDERCSEPLLALAESLAGAGSFALAALPPELRPVHDWLETRDVRAVLDNVVTSTLDGEVPWQTRRAQMNRLSRPGGAPPAIAQAAAFLLEAFGDAERARRQPFELLLAWREGKRRDWPPLPHALRKALASPLEAGMPEDDERTRGDRAEIARDALRRSLDHAPSTVAANGDLTVEMRLTAAARARAAGSGACTWLESVEVPAGVRTGCRGEGEGGGLVYSRPRRAGSSEVVSRSAAGGEVVLLLWPRLALFPVIVPDAEELLLVDSEGLWRVPLDGSEAPVRLLRGAFRYLAATPSGEATATVRWPAATVTIRGGDGQRDTDVDGRGGLAWIEPDILLASDGEALRLLSLDGASRPWPAELPCARSLAPVAGGVLAARTSPCKPGIGRLSLADGAIAELLSTPEGPFGVVRLAGGAIAFGLGGELWVWDGSSAAHRVGAGFTPGPG